MSGIVRSFGLPDSGLFIHEFEQNQSKPETVIICFIVPKKNRELTKTLILIVFMQIINLVFFYKNFSPSF